MQAISTLFPVFFMLIIGLICRVTGWVTPSQKDGTKKVVFNIFFPILIFNVLFSSSVSSSAILIDVYIIFAFLLAFLIGIFLKKWMGKRFEKVSPYMLMTCEGGSVALPLYVSIVGSAYSINTITFDIAGVIIGFILIPIMVAKQASQTTDIKALFKKIFTNSFILAVLFGLVLNLVGAYTALEQSSLFECYSNTISMATDGLVGLILFTIGYDFKISATTFKPLLKLSIVRIVTSIMIIAGFFVFFPNLVADKMFLIAILVYYMCPTGFATPLQLTPLFKSEEESYLSTFLSVYMVITLVVYTLVVSFVA